jgi:DNA modification methylase
MDGKKYFDLSWDFIGADTKAFTHCYHSYPAMMIPQVAGRLMDLYGAGARLLFDPYCGTGTSLLEANLRGINAVGTDLNPLARLIAQAKTTRPDISRLDACQQQFTTHAGNGPASIPAVKNLDYWFAPRVQQDLAAARAFIEQIDDRLVRMFFQVAFSETVRESSWTRNGEFKMYRMTPEQMARFAPDVFALMQQKLARNRQGLQQLLAHPTAAASTVLSFNTVENAGPVAPASVDLVVTSPPYGDSRTTVAYGQFSRLANEWLGIADASKLDNLLMGGKLPPGETKFDSPTLDETISQVSHKDPKRAREVAAFYRDYQSSIQHVAPLIKPGGHACYVVGNRKVKGVTLPTDEITKELFAARGFAHLETIVRNIPNKRMPSKNSPTNVPGALDNTMCQEFIVVMQKPL